MSLLIIAILAEALTETISLLVIDRKVQWGYIVALIVGQAVAWTTQLDIFKLTGVPASNGIVGIIATGLLISRGSNYLHDLIRKLQKPED